MSLQVNFWRQLDEELHVSSFDTQFMWGDETRVGQTSNLSAGNAAPDRTARGSERSGWRYRCTLIQLEGPRIPRRPNEGGLGAGMVRGHNEDAALVDLQADRFIRIRVGLHD